jgi:hypothetical protein
MEDGAFHVDRSIRGSDDQKMQLGGRWGVVVIGHAFPLSNRLIISLSDPHLGAFSGCPL